MPKIQPSKQAEELCKRLNEMGIDTQLEYWDKHKHVDIGILEAKLYVEIDGLQHYISPRQILADFERDYHSMMEGFRTIHIPKILFLHHKNRIAEALIRVVEERRKVLQKAIEQAYETGITPGAEPHP